MLFEFNHYSALLLIFFVHGLVYALLLWRRGVRQERSSDKWLALFLLLCILYITPWMVGFAGWYDNQPYRDILFYTPFQQLLLLGPVVFFYTQSLLNPSFRLRRKAVLHFLPAALYLLFCGVIVITDKLVLRRYYFLASQQDPDFDPWYQLAGFVSMCSYLLLSLRYFRLFRRLMLQVTSFADKLRFDWMRNFLQAFLLMLCLRLVFYGFSFFVPNDYADSWWYFMAFAIIFYYIAITGYGNAQDAPVAFRPALLTNKAALLVASPQPGAGETVEYIDVEPETLITIASDPVITQWKDRIAELMQAEKPYKNPELSLQELSRQLKLPPSQLSRVVNQGFGCNFNDFVNSYRVAAVKEMLAAGEQQQQTLLGIAYDCGFNSKATFNRAFRKITGLSPTDYLQRSQTTGEQQLRTFETNSDDLIQQQ